MKSAQPSVVDLFAGAGLFSQAFRSAGFTLIRAIEQDPIAAATYSKNLGPHIETGDVRRAKPFQKCDVLIAGPPCQGFSTLGARKSDDPRNSLSLEILRWAREMRPKIIVVENVAAFLNSPVWERLRKELLRLDYNVDSVVLDAVNFGVPQWRSRSFTIASRTIKPPRLRDTSRRIVTVKEAWEGLSSRPNGDNHHYAPEPSAVALARMRVIPPGGDKRDVMRSRPQLAPDSWWKLSCQVTDAWGRMEWNSPSNTLRTALQNASKGRYIHPDQHRVISLREAARLHSIPDSWVFEGLPTQVARQIGNSVPPKLGKAVANAVMKALRG